MDKVIAITGASSGFGKAMAERFNRAGASLVLTARNSAQLEELVNGIRSNGGKAVAAPVDVTANGAFEQILQAAMHNFGRIDVLINNAGGGVKIAPIEEMDDATVQSCLDLNLASVIRGCRTIAPQMKRQGSGIIINVTSACAKFAWPEWSVYSAAKSGVSMFSRCLLAELRPYGIAVSVIVPGGSRTGFQQSAGVRSFDWDETKALRPEHIAEAAFGIVNQAQGAVIPEVCVYGMAQEIIPF